MEILQRQRGDSCRKDHMELAMCGRTCTCVQPEDVPICDWLRIDTLAAHAYIFSREFNRADATYTFWRTPEARA